MAIEKLAADKLDQRIAGAKKPLLVALVRKGASPSGALLTALDGLDAKSAARADVVQVDMDESKAVMDRLRVSAEPELLLYVDGRIVERSEGEMATDEIEGLLAHTLDGLTR